MPSRTLERLDKEKEWKDKLYPPKDSEEFARKLANRMGEESQRKFESPSQSFGRFILGKSRK